MKTIRNFFFMEDAAASKSDKLSILLLSGTIALALFSYVKGVLL